MILPPLVFPALIFFLSFCEQQPLLRYILRCISCNFKNGPNWLSSIFWTPCPFLDRGEESLSNLSNWGVCQIHCNYTRIREGGRITVPLTSCLTGLNYSFFLQIKTKIVSSHTADSKPVKQEVNCTVILPPLVFPARIGEVVVRQRTLSTVTYVACYLYVIYVAML